MSSGNGKPNRLLAEERRREILSVLGQNGRITVEEVVKRFGISAVRPEGIWMCCLRTANWFGRMAAECGLWRRHRSIRCVFVKECISPRSCELLRRHSNLFVRWRRYSVYGFYVHCTGDATVPEPSGEHHCYYLCVECRIEAVRSTSHFTGHGGRSLEAALHGIRGSACRADDAVSAC